MDSHCPADAAHSNYISNLESAFSESLHIQDAQQSEHASEGDDNCDQAENNIWGVSEQQEMEVNKKCLKNLPTFPYPDIELPPSSSDEKHEETDTLSTNTPSEQSARQINSCSIRPTPLKLLSAMKGSREKQGESRIKLTVKWAPDVYDPVPTLLSHTVKSKKQQKYRNKKNEKKNGKKGQKGNSSRGGSGKDKKQFRKIPGTSDFCHKSMDSRDKVIEAIEASAEQSELGALDVGSQDSYCGTSFLKKSVTKVHYSVTEAL